MLTEALGVAQSDPEESLEERAGLGFETKRMLDHANSVLEQVGAQRESRAEEGGQREQGREREGTKRASDVAGGRGETCMSRNRRP
jgi:hypothetical protein